MFTLFLHTLKMEWIYEGIVSRDKVSSSRMKKRYRFLIPFPKFQVALPTISQHLALAYIHSSVIKDDRLNDCVNI